MDIERITREVEEARITLHKILDEIEKVIVGQRELLDRMLIGLLSDGHLLIEGVPGLAKTTAVKTLAAAIRTSFQRIQFTPDLLPADILGTQIFRPDNSTFEIRKGPIFHNVILADEINRAPAKVQSALLESMQERQVTIADQTFSMDKPFLVLATQNPIEHEGTYPLPEAQVDRFMMKIKVDYPTVEEERAIMDRAYGAAEKQAQGVVEISEIESVKTTLRSIHVEDRIRDYILRITRATRNPEECGLGIGSLISYGASPRASIWLGLASKAHALLNGRAYVVPHDVKSLAQDVLRHRVILSYQAEAEGLTADDLIKRLLEKIEVP